VFVLATCNRERVQRADDERTVAGFVTKPSLGTDDAVLFGLLEHQ